MTTPATTSQVRRSVRFRRNAAPGIHRIQHAHVNCYLVEEDGQFTLVDAALPATWPFVHQALTALGASPQDVTAVVLTHAHPDHLGIARMASSRNVVVSAERIAGVAVIDLCFSLLGCESMLIVASSNVDALPGADAKGIDIGVVDVKMRIDPYVD